jgi:hypothetical protein
MSKTLAATKKLEAPEGWSDELKAEFAEEQFSGCVGGKLLAESDWARVWEVRLKPGERKGFHRHVLDYFWTSTTDCKGKSHYPDGRVDYPVYKAGDTSFLKFAEGEFMVHDMENIGETDFVFITVEFLNSANAPIPLPDSVRNKA